MVDFNSYGIADAPVQDSTEHFGIFYGKALPMDGMSRSHQTRILTTSGSEIFCNENPDIETGMRVRFHVGFPDNLAVEALAINVRPVEPVAEAQDQSGLNRKQLCWTLPTSRTIMKWLEDAVMDVVGWLRSLGLGKYEAAFRDNEIDETVRPSLTPSNWASAEAARCHAALRSDASGKTPSPGGLPQRRSEPSRFPFPWPSSSSRCV
jgi:hypothetical protein